MTSPAFLPLSALLALALVGAALAAWVLVPRAAACRVPAGHAVTLPESKLCHAEPNGCGVRVRGFLGQNCAFEDFALSSKRGLPRVGRGGVLFAIGEDEDFDRRAHAFLDRDVAIEARFDDACMRPGIMCTDRASELQPVPGMPITLLESK